MHAGLSASLDVIPMLLRSHLGSCASSMRLPGLHGKAKAVYKSAAQSCVQHFMTQNMLLLAVASQDAVPHRQDA